MKSKTKKLTKAVKSSGLSVTVGSDFCAALNRSIKFHREAKEDPHGINDAVWVTLTEVRDALRYALNK